MRVGDTVGGFSVYRCVRWQGDLGRGCKGYKRAPRGDDIELYLLRTFIPPRHIKESVTLLALIGATVLFVARRKFPITRTSDVWRPSV